MHHVVGQPQRRADGPDFVLEQVAQRLHQLEAKIRGQATDVVMRLDPMGVVGVMAGALDHVGVEGPLRQEVDARERRRLTLEDLDEGGADAPSLLLRIDDALQRIEERLARIDGLEVNAQMTLHDIFDTPALVATQQPVVDDEAGQPTRDRAVHEGGADRRVHSS